MGQHPYHPRMLLRFADVGDGNRVVSTRRIEVLARRDVSFILSGRGASPTIVPGQIPPRNAGVIKGIFKETVLLCAQVGDVNWPYRTGWDQLKASGSKHKAMSYGRMKQEEERLERR